MENKKEITATEIAAGAGTINDFVTALDRYVFEFCNGTAELDDLNGLSGMVKALKVIAYKHYNEASEFESYR